MTHYYRSKTMNPIKYRVNFLPQSAAPKSRANQICWRFVVSRNGVSITGICSQGIGFLPDAREYRARSAMSPNVQFALENGRLVDGRPLKAPKLKDILECLCLDARFGTPTFSEYCEKLEADSDSRREYRAWLNYRKTRRKLAAILPQEQQEAILQHS